LPFQSPNEIGVTHLGARTELRDRYRHGIAERHLQAYLDELAFRFNRVRVSGERMHVQLGGLLAWTKPVPYRVLVAKRPLDVRTKIVLDLTGPPAPRVGEDPPRRTA
jgi:hypothetical protein